MTNNLKLYVVGEKSGDPERWSEYGGWCLVFAEDQKQAVEVIGDRPIAAIATEVKASSPTFIYHHDVPVY